MGVRIHCVGYVDRRSEDLHARYQVIEEQRFALRVARNHKERDRVIRELARPLPALLQRQAG